MRAAKVALYAPFCGLAAQIPGLPVAPPRGTSAALTPPPAERTCPTPSRSAGPTSEGGHGELWEEASMDHVPFYKTRGGEQFLFKTVPDLTKAIERLAAALERVVAEREHEGQERDDADA